MSNEGQKKLPAYTIPQFARRRGWSEKIVRTAVERGDIKTIEFAGLQRITPAEEERVVALLEGKAVAAP